ncbi:MAG: hypothetical protein IJY55_00445 [Clostridia bacterium]|nr:hypothetical protein [Clostridia bacterium]
MNKPENKTEDEKILQFYELFLHHLLAAVKQALGENEKQKIVDILERASDKLRSEEP